MKKIFILSIFLFATVSIAFAQVELSLQGTIESPLGDLKKVFKSGNGAILTISKTNTYKKNRTTWGGSIGYSKFVPKQDLFYYSVASISDGAANGTIKYDDMQAYQLSIQLRRDFIIKKMELFYGLEFGFYYTKYGYESHDPYNSEESRALTGRGAMAPKVGVNFQVSENIGVFAQTRYVMSLGSPDISGKMLFTFLANSVGLNFRF